MLAMYCAERGSTGAWEMSWLSGLFAGNSGQPYSRGPEDACAGTPQAATHASAIVARSTKPWGGVCGRMRDTLRDGWAIGRTSGRPLGRAVGLGVGGRLLGHGCACERLDSEHRRARLAQQRSPA